MEKNWESLNAKMLIDNTKKAFNKCTESFDCDTCPAVTVCKNVKDCLDLCKHGIYTLLTPTTPKYIESKYLPPDDFGHVSYWIDRFDWMIAQDCKGNCETCYIKPRCEQADEITLKLDKYLKEIIRLIDAKPVF